MYLIPNARQQDVTNWLDKADLVKLNKNLEQNMKDLIRYTVWLFFSPADGWYFVSLSLSLSFFLSQVHFVFCVLVCVLLCVLLCVSVCLRVCVSVFVWKKERELWDNFKTDKCLFSSIYHKPCTYMSYGVGKTK